MSPLGPAVVLIGAFAGVLSSAWSMTSDFARNYRFFNIANMPKLYCYTLTYVWRHGWEYRFHPEGTPCWLSLIRRNVGYCSHGKCIANKTPEMPGCSEVHNGEGYLTKCLSNTCDGVACINVFTKPTSATAGICKKGVCVPFYELTYQEQKLAHPYLYQKCREKEHHGRNVLSNCYYYCSIDNAWYHGYYSSNLTSSCYLANPRPNRELGWCCEGRCLEMAHCLAS
uniref:Putative tick 18.3 kDa family protein n=1 Tax=Rhipicephalus pulchellus TaxID=72859 RepID=L7M8L0_RHIPC